MKATNLYLWMKSGDTTQQVCITYRHVLKTQAFKWLFLTKLDPTKVRNMEAGMSFMASRVIGCCISTSAVVCVKLTSQHISEAICWLRLGVHIFNGTWPTLGAATEALSWVRMLMWQLQLPIPRITEPIDERIDPLMTHFEGAPGSMGVSGSEDRRRWVLGAVILKNARV